jgi:hypothetical protein
VIILADEKKQDSDQKTNSRLPKISTVHVVIAIAVLILAVIFIAKFGYNMDLLTPSSGEMAIVKRPVTPVPTLVQNPGVKVTISLRPVAVPTCDTPKRTCGDSCVDIYSDPGNCGACGNVCSELYKGNKNVAAYGCSGAHCTVTSCLPGYGNCGGTDRPDSGGNCQWNLMDGTSSTYNQYDMYAYQERDQTKKIYLLNSHNCGSCGNYCAGGSSYFGICDNGACRQVCWGPWLNCDTTMTNGCEQVFNDDNCGACGAKCAADALCKNGCCVLRSDQITKAPDSLGVTCSGNMWNRQGK